MLCKNKKKLFFWNPVIRKKEILNIKRVLDSNHPNEGIFTRLFEQKIKKLLNVKYAVCVTSGTSSIFLALKSLGIKAGDEVIIPDLTFGATANAVNWAGAKLILCDVDDNLSLDISVLKKLINKKTKAIIPVHVSGRATNFDQILRLAKKNTIFVIEDAAEALFSKYQKKFLGTFGHIGCFSLTASKIITTGQGGVLVTNNKFFFNEICLLKNNGVQFMKNDNFKHIRSGYNFKFTNIQAAMGLAQIDTIESRVLKLKNNYKLYYRELKNVNEIKVQKFDIKNGSLPLWITVLAKSNNHLFYFLKKKNIFCRKFWYPLHTQLPYKKNKKFFKKSSVLSKELLWLPSSLMLSKKDIIYICTQIKKFYSKFN